LWNVLTWRATRRRLEHRVQKLEATSREWRARWKRGQRALKRAGESHRRRILSPQIVRGLLAERVPTIAARASRANAAALEAQFLATSTAYSDARSPSQALLDHLVRTDLQGLVWWIPVPPSLTGAARDRFLQKQRFPYRNITQTREFALGPIMIDVGANTGRMSIPRVILGDFAQAYCAEPDPLNYAALVRNVVDNDLRGLVLPDRVAVGSSNGVANLQHAKYPGGHRLVTGTDVHGVIEVPCMRLDDWCERLRVDPALVTYVKVDTQGWELEVLRGATALLRFRHIAWQLEISPSLLDAAGASAAELYDLCAHHFSHFVDVGKSATGPRARRIADLRLALQYIEGDEAQTDIVLFNAALADE
jgi:FkbM family methyltransferase